MAPPQALVGTEKLPARALHSQHLPGLGLKLESNGDMATAKCETAEYAATGHTGFSQALEELKPSVRSEHAEMNSK